MRILWYPFGHVGEKPLKLTQEPMEGEILEDKQKGRFGMIFIFYKVEEVRFLEFKCRKSDSIYNFISNTMKPSYFKLIALLSIIVLGSSVPSFTLDPTITGIVASTP